MVQVFAISRWQRLWKMLIAVAREILARVKENTVVHPNHISFILYSDSNRDSVAFQGLVLRQWSVASLMWNSAFISLFWMKRYAFIEELEVVLCSESDAEAKWLMFKLVFIWQLTEFYIHCLSSFCSFLDLDNSY